MRIPQKEKIQLGYEPNSSPKTPSRSSDIDFSDVFGGPPRRASLQEMQNKNHNDDTWRGDGDGNDEMLPGRSSWSVNASEKPVFGSEVSNRRRYPSRDFFDDIFRADQSQSSSPRMSVRDPISSAPGSRVLSPVRPLPPGAIPLGSPAQFSLPARLASSHSSSNLSRLSSQGVNHDAYQGGDALSPYRRSPLSHKTSSNGEELGKDVNLNGAQAPSGGNQFHFSIHKWASRGMPLVMSLGKRNSLRSKIKFERALSLNGNVEDQNDTLIDEIQPAAVNTDGVLSFNVHVVPAAKETKESDQIVDKSVIDVPKFSPIYKLEDGNSPAEESEVPALFKNSVSKDVSKPKIDTNKSDLKQRSNKLHGVEETSGNDSAIPQTRVNKMVVENKSSEVDKREYGEEKAKTKEKSSLKDDNKRNNINFQKNLGNDTARENVKESTGNDRVGENLKVDKRKDGARGKVKEFVKIFNQEPSIKTAADIDGRWRNTDSLREHSKSTLSSTKTQGKMQGFDMNSRLDSSSKVDENHKVSSGKQMKANSVQEPCQSSSIESENMGSTIGSDSDGFKSSSANIDVAFDNILIEELPEIQDKTSKNVENDEDIGAYESKVLKWSKGKEGNIRALLSTLQYVLWPNSGWKPVPLVDIIEANAVKRSYQRALLYIHPDKLQQKGVTSHHKYIAEKVFDILQEAWDTFNNLGSL